MKLIVGPVTFKQHQRHCREKKRCRSKPAAYRCALLGQAGKRNTATLTPTCALASIIYTPSWYSECSHFLRASFQQAIYKENYELSKQLIKWIICHIKLLLIFAKLCFPRTNWDQDKQLTCIATVIFMFFFLQVF